MDRVETVGECFFYS